MLRKIVVSTSLLMLLISAGCNNSEIAQIKEQVADLNRRVATLERRPNRQMPAPQATAYNLPAGQSAVLGNANAPITLTVFSDYECPYCAKADVFLQDVLKDPELKDKVRVVFKQFPLPFHKSARPAAKAALAAGEQGSDKFWAMTQKIFENQAPGALTPDNLAKWAKASGVDMKKFELALKNDDAKFEAMIKADMDLGINVAHVGGTPAMYINGWELKQRSMDGIKDLIRDKKLN